MSPIRPGIERTVSSYCYQCVAGPDLLKVIVKDGVAVGVEPNADLAGIHPACGRRSQRGTCQYVRFS